MLLGFLPAAYLARLFPFQDWGWLAYWAFLFGVAIILGLGVWLATNRNGITTLIAMLAIVTGVIAVDVLTGAHLQFNSTLGYSPTVAGRYAGIGNLAYAQLSAGTLLLAGLVAARVAGRRGVGIAIALMLGAFVIDGAPIFGADVGGVLSMVPGVRAHRDDAARLAGALAARRAVRRRDAPADRRCSPRSTRAGPRPNRPTSGGSSTPRPTADGARSRPSSTARSMRTSR